MCVCSDSVLLVTLNPLAESMASFFRAASPYLILYLFYLIVFPFKELSLHLGGLPVWESALVSARDKGVGLITVLDRLTPGPVIVSLVYLPNVKGSRISR